MNRYIDADALMGRMYHEAFENDASYNESNPMAKWDSGLWIRYKMFENVIDEAPSINIESKQGEWIVDEGGWKGLDYYPPKCKCNQCGYEEELYIIHAKPTNFCPNCGCQMKVADDE